MAKQMKVKGFFGNDVTVTMTKQKYDNGNLRIQLWCDDGPFATLTTYSEKKLPEGHAYVDTNNCPWAEQFIKKYNLGVHQGKFKMSGYCCYPMYKFFD